RPAIDQQRQIIRRPLDPRRRVVLRDRSAQHHSPPQRQIRQRRLQNLPAHIIEINVHSLRAVLRDRLPHILALVINRRVESQLLLPDPPPLGPPPTPPSRPPFALRSPPPHASPRSRRRRHHHHIARL